jgi:hypothetical protein
MDIALGLILAVRMREDHETASVDLRSHDKLKGAIKLESIALDTVFGNVAIGIEHITNFRFTLADGTLPRPLRKGLVLYYPFNRNEGERVTDESEMQTHGQMRGARWTSRGKVGGALEFNGQDGQVVLGVGELAKEQVAVSMWVMPAKSQQGALAEFDVGGTGLLLYDFSDKAHMGFRGASRQWLTQSTTLVPDTWTHVVWVYVGGDRSAESSVAIYVNGLPQKLSALGAVGSTFQRNCIGAESNGFTFSGEIDEVMVFDRALTEEEIRQIYDLQK